MRPSMLSSVMLCMALGAANLMVAAGLNAAWRPSQPGGGPLSGPAPWVAMFAAILAAVLLWNDWKKREEEWRAYTGIVAATLNGFWAGLVANLLMTFSASVATRYHLEWVMIGGIVPAMAISTAAGLRDRPLRAISLLGLPAVVGGGAILLARLVSSIDTVFLVIVVCCASALGAGLLGGIGKGSRSGIIVGLVGGAFGAAGAFFSLLIVGRTSMQNPPVWMFLHAPIAVAAAQFLIASCLHFVDDSQPRWFGKSGPSGAMALKRSPGRVYAGSQSAASVPPVLSGPQRPAERPTTPGLEVHPAPPQTGNQPRSGPE